LYSAIKSEGAEAVVVQIDAWSVIDADIGVDTVETLFQVYYVYVAR